MIDCHIPLSNCPVRENNSTNPYSRNTKAKHTIKLSFRTLMDDIPTVETERLLWALTTIQMLAAHSENLES